MGATLKSRIQLIFFIALGVFLVWLSIHNIPDKDIETTKQSFKEADYFFVIISALLSLIAHIIRAWRWDALLKPLGYSISFKNSFAAVMIGYVVNYAIPRAGELSRCGVANRYEKIPFAAALGTVITERILDLFLLLLLFIITLAVEFEQLLGLTNQYILNPLCAKFSVLMAKTLVFYGLISFMILFILALIIFRKKIAVIFSGKLGGILKSFAGGLKSVKNVQNPLLFILQSILIWFFYFISLYVCFWCFPQTKTLGLGAALSVLLFGTFGVMFSPGGVGAYQLIATQVLIFYGVMNSVAISFPWIAWGSQLIMILVIGGVCFLLLPVLNKHPKDENVQRNS